MNKVVAAQQDGFYRILLNLVIIIVAWKYDTDQTFLKKKTVDAINYPINKIIVK